MQINKYFILILSLIFGFTYCSERPSEKKILVLGVIKDGEKGFENSKKSIQKLVKNFLDYRIIVYENNSIDNTKKLYSSWANEDSKVTFLSENLTPSILQNYTPRKGDYRCEFIARARNIVLEKAMSSEFDDFDYIMMSDLDEFDPWDIEEILNSIENPKADWDSISANGSYDLYTIRSDEFRLNPELIGWPLWINLQPKIGKIYADILAKEDWLKVESAFGGLAIYRREAVRGCRYKGLFSSDYVKKLININYKKDLIYVQNPFFYEKIIRHNLHKLMKWQKSGFKSEYLPTDCYASDHVQFHHQMIRNGRDKIYVNPKWKHRSKIHRNY